MSQPSWHHAYVSIHFEGIGRLKLFGIARTSTGCPTIAQLELPCSQIHIQTASATLLEVEAQVAALIVNFKEQT